MDRNIVLLGREDTYRHIWDNYLKSRRIVINRYGDGEFLIMQGMKRPVATHKPNIELTKLLQKSITYKGQLICIPMKMKLFGGIDSNENSEDSRVKTGRYIVNNSDHTFYGHDAWRRLDIYYGFNFITEFFIGKTLLVTGNHKECKSAFDANEVPIDVLEARKSNAFEDYNYLKETLLQKCKIYKNIIFALGPTSNVLMVDLLPACRSNMLDLGGLLGALVNPYSPGENLAKQWTGFSKRASKEMLRRISKVFFKKLTDKIDLYGE